MQILLGLLDVGRLVGVSDGLVYPGVGEVVVGYGVLKIFLVEVGESGQVEVEADPWIVSLPTVCTLDYVDAALIEGRALPGVTLTPSSALQGLGYQLYTYFSEL